MQRLTIVLKHGFANDHAVVRVNGELVLDHEGLTTRTTVDRATALDHDVPEGRVKVEIDIPTRGLKKSVEFDVRGRQSLVVHIGRGPEIDTQVVAGIAGDA